MSLEQQIIAGRYALVRRVGAGGAAQVYLARDNVLGRDVAVKILHPEAAADNQFVERFRREARSAAALNHPNIASIYDWGATGATYYMVMEYVPGRNLKEILRGGPLTEKQALEIAVQAADALETAHDRGVIHRDVKPQNILVTPRGRVKVVDFGIARAAGSTQLTESNMVCGTAHYLSPEQLEGGPIDDRSDVYSLGIVLYEMLVGKEPFRGESLVEVALKHLQQQPSPPRSLRPDITLEAEHVVLKALSKNPEARYSSMAQMREALLSVSSQSAGYDTAEEPSASAGRQAATPTARVGPPVAGATNRSALSPHPDGSRRRASWLAALPLLLLLPVAGLLVALWGNGTHHSAHRSNTPGPRHVAQGIKPRATDVPTSRPRAIPASTRPQSAGSSSALQPSPTPQVRATSAIPTATPVPSTPVPVQPTATVVAPPTEPAAPHVLSASAPAGDPTSSVSDFYSAISEGRLSQALAFWTQNMQNSCDPSSCIFDRFGHTQSIRIQSRQVLYQSDNEAAVRVTVYDQEGEGSSRASGPITLTWYLVNDGSGWRLNNVGA